MISNSPPVTIINTWVKASWNEFLAVAAAEVNPDLEKASFYYDTGYMMIEQMPTGFSHDQDHYLLFVVIGLYGTFKSLSFLPGDHTSFRKAGGQECQVVLSIAGSLTSFLEGALTQRCGKLC